VVHAQNFHFGFEFSFSPKNLFCSLQSLKSFWWGYDTILSSLVTLNDLSGVYLHVIQISKKCFYLIDINVNCCIKASKITVQLQIVHHPLWWWHTWQTFISSPCSEACDKPKFPSNLAVAGAPRGKKFCKNCIIWGYVTYMGPDFGARKCIYNSFKHLTHWGKSVFTINSSLDLKAWQIWIKHWE